MSGIASALSGVFVAGAAANRLEVCESVCAGGGAVTTAASTSVPEGALLVAAAKTAAEDGIGAVGVDAAGLGVGSETAGPVSTGAGGAI